MVMIKDNVNLKKLEKLGFSYNDDTGKYIKCQIGNINMQLIVRTWDRKIYTMANPYCNPIRDTELLEVMYDLIQNRTSWESEWLNE